MRHTIGISFVGSLLLCLFALNNQTNVAALAPTRTPKPTAVDPIAAGKIAYVNSSSGELILINGDGTNPQKLADNVSIAAGLAWSPDGKQIAYGLSGTKRYSTLESISILDISTAKVKSIETTGYAPLGLNWSSDGKEILFGVQLTAPKLARIVSVDIETGKLTELFELKPSQDADMRLFSFSLSPDGKQFVYMLNSPYMAPSELRVVDVDGKNDRLLYKLPYIAIAWPQWSPNGKRIVLVGTPDNAVGLTVLDVSSGAKKAISLQPSAKFPVMVLTTSVVWTGDGKQIVALGSGPLTIVNSDGTNRHEYDPLPDSAFTPLSIGIVNAAWQPSPN